MNTVPWMGARENFTVFKNVACQKVGEKKDLKTFYLAPLGVFLDYLNGMMQA